MDSIPNITQNRVLTSNLRGTHPMGFSYPKNPPVEHLDPDPLDRPIPWITQSQWTSPTPKVHQPIHSSLVPIHPVPSLPMNSQCLFSGSFSSNSLRFLLFFTSDYFLLQGKAFQFDGDGVSIAPRHGPAGAVQFSGCFEGERYSLLLTPQGSRADVVAIRHEPNSGAASLAPGRRSVFN